MEYVASFALGSLTPRGEKGASGLGWIGSKSRLDVTKSTILFLSRYRNPVVKTVFSPSRIKYIFTINFSPYLSITPRGGKAWKYTHTQNY
jgi:hypothetical protein